MSWTPVFSAVGPAGAQLRTGSGPPASSLGNVSDTYVDTTSSGAPIFYAAKASSGWPSTGQSLVGGPGATGTAGSQFLFGTTQPGPPTFGGLNIGDYFLRSDTYNLYQFQRVSGSVGLVAVGNLQGAQGVQGFSVLTGSGSPSSSVGVANQAYIDLVGGVLYVRGSSAWPSTGTSLVGAQGNFLRTGSGPPASSLGNVGDTYYDTAASIFYAAKTASGWPSTGTSLVGAAGAAGALIQTGTGSPASSLGSVNDIYIDTTANAVTLYGKKTSGGWPSSGTLLQGAQGVQGIQGLVGNTGPASPSIVSGTGAPSSTNPGGTIVAGSFYIRTDTVPNYLYGPYTTANGWPATYTLLGGGTFQTSNGPPASTLGAIGDCDFDLTNALFYPPKTSNGWTSSPVNMVGPTGPSVQVQPLLGSLATGAGPSAYANGVSAASTPVVMALASTPIASSFAPNWASSFVQATIVNASNSSGSIQVQLYDQTAGNIIYTSPSYGTGTINTVGFFAAGTYPLVSGNTVVWRVVGAATAYVAVQPSYLYQSSTGIGVSAQPTFALGSTALSTTATYLLIPGSTVLTGYWTSPKVAYLNTAQFNIAGSGASATFYLYSGSTIIYTSPVITSANSPFNVGPLGLNGSVMPAATTLSWRVTGSGTATSTAVNWSALQ